MRAVRVMRITEGIFEGGKVPVTYCCDQFKGTEMKLKHCISFSKPNFGKNILTCGILTAGLGTAALADPSTVIDYPKSGVELGQGWNSFAVSKTTATCIIFQKAHAQAGQEKTMSMRAVTSRYQLDKELGISASASYKGATGSISGKASYASSVNIETTGTSVAALARVDDGNIYVGIPNAEAVETITEMLANGATPDEINTRIGETAATVNQRTANILPDLISSDIVRRHNGYDLKKINAATGTGAGAIRLAPEFEKLAAEDPQLFRKTCGDSFVATISQGGDLAMVFTFETRSLNKQQEIAASLKGSGWGVTASGDMKSKIQSAAENTTTTMTYHQTGGSGDPIPTNLDELYDKIRTFPEAVQNAPYSYQLQLARYEDLVNWPKQSENPHAGYKAIDELTYALSVWDRLDKDVSGVLDQTSNPFGVDAFLLGRGVNRANLLQAQVDIRGRRDAVENTIKNCLSEAQAAEPCDPATETSKLGLDVASITSDEMTYRAQMPLPINPVVNPPERLSPADKIRQAIYGMYIQKVNAARCETKSAAVCLPALETEKYRDQIKVDTKPLFVVLSNQLNNACLVPASSSALVNLSEGCSFTDANRLFYWDAAKKHLVHNATGKCVNVRAGSKSNSADIILFKCQAAKHKNDQWSLPSVSKTNRWIRIKNAKSAKCLVVTGEVRSGRRTTQYDCSKGTGKSMVWRFVMQ